MSDQETSGGARDAFPGGDKLGRLGMLAWPVTHYLVTNLTVTLGCLLFFFFNRTVFVGKKNVPLRGNTLLLSNHQTLIDSFLVGIGAFYPASWFHPKIMPWHPAAVENYYRNPFLAWLAANWKCIPVKPGRRDMASIRRMLTGIKTSPVMIFPEGTRSRDGSIGEARGGAGMLILMAKPTVIPVCVDGMDQVLPVGARFPRFFKRVMVRYGKPLDLSEFFEKKRTKESIMEMMERVMDAIRELRKENEKSGFFTRQKTAKGSP